MPIVGRGSTNKIQAGGTKLTVAQHARAANYAKPTDADSAIVDPVDINEASRRAVVTNADHYITKDYRVNDVGLRYVVAALENQTIQQGADRSKPEPGPLNAEGPVIFTNVTEGQEPWLQHLTCDKSPTAEVQNTDELKWTFTPGNDALELLTSEISKGGEVPNRAFGIQPNQLSFNLARADLSVFTYDCLALDYQLNTAGTTAAAGTPIPARNDTTGIRTIPTVAGMDITDFDTIPSRGFPGWSAVLRNAQGMIIGGSNASFTYNNNFVFSDELIGTQGAAGVDRGDNVREVSATFTLPYSRENLTMAYDFIEGSDNGAVTIEFKLERAGQPTVSLSFKIANSFFEEMPDPPVSGRGRIDNPINMIMLPTEGMNNILTIEYVVPLNKAVQLQTYN